MKFIGIDIGTTTITGLVYDLERRTILHSNTEDNPVSSHLSSEEWERLQDLIRQCCPRYCLLER